MPQPETTIIAAAIDDLEHFRSRVGMYIGHADVHAASHFLMGFRVGLSASGIRFVDDAWWKVQAERGWRMAASGPVYQMEQKGMDVPAIIFELVEIEIEMLRRHTVPAG